ncbi:type IV toxin-antitoxin system AbiEi family antitoxin domain-containing protein [Antrihabitans stalagmiti]|nr:type IV toxin-antitoxin system AbiEi family antitoxin domain-containing protein [Antrihabitans stalagmiti]
MTPKKVHSIMAAQDGVVTLAQALGAGMSDAGVSRRVCAGEWRRLSTGIYLRSDRTCGPAAGLRAAVYGAGPDAVAYGPSAAWWLGLIDTPPRQNWVTVPCRRTPRDRPGLRLRRRDLPAADLGSRRGLPTTALALTVLEAAVELPNGAAMMDRALQKHVSLPVLTAAHERNAGRSGSTAAAALLRSAGEGGASEAERMLQRLLRRSGLRGWSQHVRSCGFEIDVAFEAQRVAIEVDGWAWHRDADRFVRDAERQNILVNAGWHVLRFTWHQLHDSPETALESIRTALAARR